VPRHSMKMSCGVAILLTISLTCLFAAGAHAAAATDAEAMKVFQRLKRYGLADYLDIGEMTGGNLKWLQYDTDYDNPVTK